MDQKFDTLDKNVTSKFDQIMVRLDETHAVAKLGLEGWRAARINGREVRSGGKEQRRSDGAAQVSPGPRQAARRRLGPAWRAAPEIMIPWAPELVAIPHVPVDEGRQAVAGFGELLHALDAQGAGLLDTRSGTPNRT